MDVRVFESWMSHQAFEGLTDSFAPGRPPGYPRGRPREFWPQNLLFGLLFRSSFNYHLSRNYYGNNSFSISEM